MMFYKEKDGLYNNENTYSDDPKLHKYKYIYSFILH